MGLPTAQPSRLKVKNVTVRSVLKRAKRILKTNRGKGHFHTVYARNKNCYCALGALAVAATGYPHPFIKAIDNEVYLKARDKLTAAVGTDIINWNDWSATDDQVQEAFDRALASI